jgi:hypothetical protein
MKKKILIDLAVLLYIVGFFLLLFYINAKLGLVA